MPKRATTEPLVLPPRDGRSGSVRWLCDGIRGEILAGRLGPGARLPSTRELAAQYGLSRGTVVAAFDQLRSEAYLSGRVGSGTRVSNVLPDDLLDARHLARHEMRVSRARRRLAPLARRIKLFLGYEPRTVRAFRADQPALDLFPTSLWAQVAGRRLRRVTRSELLGTGPLGYRPLQRAIAAYLTRSRGVRCDPGQVAVVSGIQEAVDIVARLTVEPGARVGMEDPGYTGAARVFEMNGARIVPLPIDHEGVRTGGAAWRRLRVVYVTPARQFPLGVPMSVARRLELLEWARLERAIILEDDYDAEFRYRGKPIPALQGLDRHGVVCFAGTFSKVLFPSLRLAYLIVPPDLVDAVAALKSIASRHAPLLDQAILCDFIEEGHFGRHVRRMRGIYASRLEALLHASRMYLEDVIELSPIEAGLSTVGWLPKGVSGLRVETAASQRGVEVTALSRYARRRMEREGIQLGFAAVDEAELTRGARELAIALRGMR